VLPIFGDRSMAAPLPSRPENAARRGSLPDFTRAGCRGCATGV